MLTVLLHKSGMRLSAIQKEFYYEHVELVGKLWKRGKEIPEEIFEANAVIIACDSPNFEIFEILPDLRKRQPKLPIIIIDSTENHETKMRSYALGADVYFSEPINYRELAMRIKNLVCKKEISNNGNKLIQAFDLQLNKEQMAAKRGTRSVSLRNKEFALLEFFILNRGRVLTRNAILEHVWDRNANFASNTVDVHINRLRRKIDDKFRDKLIHTVYCIGYIFDKRRNN